MEPVKNPYSSISDKYPTYRDEILFKVPYKWLDGKRIDDNAEGLWRVHDKLYDLTDFVSRHPGGSEWLTLTKGIDITEMFETHHLTGKAEQLLGKYYVRDAKLPRNYKITFKEDGFYKTFKRRVAAMLSDLDYRPKKTSDLYSDLTLGLIFAVGLMAAKDNNIYLAIVLGLLLNCQLVIAHNYFHRKDNWRMFCFNLTALNYTEWRISHAMSHHLYTNTYYDLEMTFAEPHLQWIPRPKTLTYKILSCIFSPLIYSMIIYFSLAHRTLAYFDKTAKPRWDHLIPFTLPLAMYYFGQQDLFIVLKLWLISIGICSFMVGVTGINSGHHHPETAHEGDELPKSMDFGLFQMNAVIDRDDIKSNHFITLTTFGHHTLHHMFPTLDHGLLSQLHPVFLETCKEFEIELREYPWWPLIVGQFEQLIREKPHTLKEMKLKNI